MIWRTYEKRSRTSGALGMISGPLWTTGTGAGAGLHGLHRAVRRGSEHGEPPGTSPRLRVVPAPDAASGESRRKKSDGGYAVSDFQKVPAVPETFMEDLRTCPMPARKESVSAWFRHGYYSDGAGGHAGRSRGEEEFRTGISSMITGIFRISMSRPFPEVFPQTAPGASPGVRKREGGHEATFHPYQWDPELPQSDGFQ